MKVLSRVLCLVLCLPLLVIGQQKITWEKDGSEMALIPAGSFEMGDHFDGMRSALPVHMVTVGQFKEFVNQSGYNYGGNWDTVAKQSPGDEYPMIYVNRHNFQVTTT